MKEIAVITKSELAKAHKNMLNADQLTFLLKKTPKEHIYTRPAKGGGNWNFVTGVYVKKVLNLIFGWDWSFEVVEHKFDLGIRQAYVLGKLTVRSQGKEVVKMQFGRVDIKFKTTFENSKKVSTNQPLDIGNDLKAATTDALKKCASELGICSDVYAPNEFKEIKVVDDVDYLGNIKKLLKTADLNANEYCNIERIIKEEETKSYSKALKILNSKQNVG